LLNLLELEGDEQFEQHHDDKDEDIELNQYQQIDLISQRQHVASNKLEEVNADLQDLLLQLALQAEDGRTPRADGGEVGLTSRRMTIARSNAGSPNASGVLNRDGLTSARGPPSFFPTVSTLFPTASTLGLPQAQAQASPTRPSPPPPPPPTNDE
jgi:hypothetical protein